MIRTLSAKQRAFADAWQGPGSGVAAAQAAGYGGSPHALGAAAARLLRHPGVVARIELKYGRPLAELRSAPATAPSLELARLAAEAAAHDDGGEQLELAIDPAPPPTPIGTVKGRGRGTPTERIELAMEISRDPRASRADRLKALELAAKLEGELTSGRLPRAPVVLPPPTALEPAARPHPKLTLVLSPEDEERAR